MTRPTVFLAVSDHRRLTAAAIRSLLEAPRIAAALLEELERAVVAPDHALAPDIARLGSWVDYLDDGERRRGQLVLEAESSSALPALSITGAALIGLSVGETIVLPDRRGAERRLTLLGVEPGDDPTEPDDAGLRRSLKLAGLTT